MSNTETSGFTRLIVETHRSESSRKKQKPARAKLGLVPPGDLGHDRWFVDNAPAVVHLDINDLEEVDNEPGRARDPWENADTRPYDPRQLPQYADQLRPQPKNPNRRWAIIAILFGGVLWGIVAVYLLAGGTTSPSQPKPVAHPAPPALAPALSRPAPALPAPAPAPAPVTPLITPVPIRATLELPSLTATTSVHIDGIALGAGPMRIDQLEAGHHVLLLQLPGGEPRSLDITLAPGVVTRIAETATPPAAAPSRARSHRHRSHRKR